MNEFLNNGNRRHLCVAVDAKDYSKLDAVGQEELQATMTHILDQAARLAGLDRLAWALQDQGDGELALVPGDQDERLVVDDFPRELDALLRRHNHGRLSQARLRLRMAVHFGIAYPAGKGYAGPAAVLVHRLLESRELHEALARAEGSNLAVALSDGVYSDLILNRLTSLQPEDFRAQPIKTDKFEGRAWIRVPGSPADAAQPGEGAQPVDPRREDQDEEATERGDTYRVTNKFGDNAHVDVAGFKIVRRTR